MHSNIFELKAPFRIARGVKHAAETLTVKLDEAGVFGCGECVPYERYGETPLSVRAAIEAVSGAIEAGMTRDELNRLMEPGAARSALDCALWDLEAQQKGVSVSALLGLEHTQAIETAQTVSIDTPFEMYKAAQKLSAYRLIKVKLGGDDVIESLSAVRAALPAATLIADANEAWSMAELVKYQPKLGGLGVALLEQPLAQGQDHELEGFSSTVPICADESCYTTADIDLVASRYGAINIKIDKCGGLSEAARLLEAAKDRGMKVMVGCTLASSLAISPAFTLAVAADFADLDGPDWLKVDRTNGFIFEDGRIKMENGHLWGQPRATRSN